MCDGFAPRSNNITSTVLVVACIDMRNRDRRWERKMYYTTINIFCHFFLFCLFNIKLIRNKNREKSLIKWFVLQHIPLVFSFFFFVFYSVDIIKVRLKIDILRQSLVSLLYSHLSLFSNYFHIYKFLPIRPREDKRWQQRYSNKDIYRKYASVDRKRNSHFFFFSSY